MRSPHTCLTVRVPEEIVNTFHMPTGTALSKSGAQAVQQISSAVIASFPAVRGRLKVTKRTSNPNCEFDVTLPPILAAQVISNLGAKQSELIESIAFMLGAANRQKSISIQAAQEEEEY